MIYKIWWNSNRIKYRVTSFPLILGVKSEYHIEEESVENPPSQQDEDIVPDIIQLNAHGGYDILANQGTVQS